MKRINPAHAARPMRFEVVMFGRALWPGVAIIWAGFLLTTTVLVGAFAVSGLDLLQDGCSGLLRARSAI